MKIEFVIFANTPTSYALARTCQAILAMNLALRYHGLNFDKVVLNRILGMHKSVWSVSADGRVTRRGRYYGFINEFVL